MEDATHAPPTSEPNTLRRKKTLTRPERYQPAAPLIGGKKERKPFDPWVLFARVITIWAPGALLSKLGLPDKQSRQAWREKFALCFIAAIMGGIVVFLTIGLRPLLCPESQATKAKAHVSDAFLELSQFRISAPVSNLGFELSDSAEYLATCIIDKRIFFSNSISHLQLILFRCAWNSWLSV